MNLALSLGRNLICVLVDGRKGIPWLGRQHKTQGGKAEGMYSKPVMIQLGSCIEELRKVIYLSNKSWISKK